MGLCVRLGVLYHSFSDILIYTHKHGTAQAQNLVQRLGVPGVCRGWAYEERTSLFLVECGNMITNKEEHKTSLLHIWVASTLDTLSQGLIFIN